MTGNCSCSSVQCPVCVAAPLNSPNVQLELSIDETVYTCVWQVWGGWLCRLSYVLSVWISCCLLSRVCVAPCRCDGGQCTAIPTLHCIGSHSTTHTHIHPHYASRTHPIHRASLSLSHTLFYSDIRWSNRFLLVGGRLALHSHRRSSASS